MPRWDYDTVFYRVCCITLLGVAFIFTVILTNVFVDIDDLLSKKDTGEAKPLDPVPKAMPEVINTGVFKEHKLEDIYNDNQDYEDSSYLYRTKRSLEPQDLVFNINDPKVKMVLTNRLASLLQELDDEDEFTNNSKHDEAHAPNLNDTKENSDHSLDNNIHATDNNITKEKILSHNNKNDVVKTNEDITIKKVEINAADQEESRRVKTLEEELQHLAMHNIILKGIINHIDLNEVYKNVQAMVKNFKNDSAIGNTEAPEKYLNKSKPDEKNEHTLKEDEFINELVNCKELQKEIGIERSISGVKEDKYDKKSNGENKKSVAPRNHNVMIKMIIDITALANGNSNKGDTSKEKVNGMMKLIYNGKSIKFKRIDDDVTITTPAYSSTKLYNYGNAQPRRNYKTSTYAPKAYFSKVIQDYLKKFPKELQNLENEYKESKRAKRHVKVRYDNDKTTEKPKVASNKNDDELFVEIETHFDSKGMKGEKKKKLIKDLIQKIQKAIHSGGEVKKKKHKHLHVKKRTQSPFDQKSATVLLNKIMMPLESLMHREIDPISKAVPLSNQMPLVSDDSGNDWMKTYNGPGFLFKSINSAEMSEVDTDYNRVITSNGIPQRLQLPLNSDMSEEMLNTNVFNLGNITFLVKDIEGSGFTIGFNQFKDEEPDPETMKLFTGLESVLQNYHQTYDQDTHQQQNTNVENDNTNYLKSNEMQKYSQTSDPEEHIMERRSIQKPKEVDFHSNEYKVIFNSNFLPYNNYQRVSYDEENSHVRDSIRKVNKTNDKTFISDENVSINIGLKPAKIISIADLFERQKRSIHVKKISKVKSKNKVNKFLNTKTMASRSIFTKRKRNKRQIDKIRIIASDLPDFHKHSDEDIFVVSDEKVFADRAVVREVETPETIQSHPDHNELNIFTEDHYDLITPQKVTGDHYDIYSPYDAPTYETQNTNFFSRRSRHNSLMSKYPHILLEEISRSKEELYPDNFSYGRVLENVPTKVETTTHSVISKPTADVLAPKIQELADIMSFPRPEEKSNYKVTVKIMPKNITGVNAGFKEVHTTINKSYVRNGLTYTSLVNVSEVSKVENQNESNNFNGSMYPGKNNLRQQQEMIKALIQQHKNRIEEQLRHLNTDREKLESIDIKNIENLPEALVKAALPSNPTDVLSLTKEELSKLFNFTPETTTIKPTTRAITTQPTIITTTEYIAPTTVDADKIKIINTIERNENVTNQILMKIDQNTGILQVFLDKLMSKLQEPTRKSTQTPDNVQANKKGDFDIENAENAYNNQLKNVPQAPQDLKEYHQNLPNIFFSNNMPRELRNNSMAIPFVYAYQQPYEVPNSNKNIPVANIVYHGHIHTNTGSQIKRDIENKKNANLKVENQITEPKNTETRPNTKESTNVKTKNDNTKSNKELWESDSSNLVRDSFPANNSTRFFIDDLENDFIVKKPCASLRLPINMTNV